MSLITRPARTTPIPSSAQIDVLSVRGGEDFVQLMFERLYRVHATTNGEIFANVNVDRRDDQVRVPNAGASPDATIAVIALSSNPSPRNSFTVSATWLGSVSASS